MQSWWNLDFCRWCAWVEAQIAQSRADAFVMRFKLGPQTSKRGAGVEFEADDFLMLLEFWESGEADLSAMPLPSEDLDGLKIVYMARILNDSSFEAAFKGAVSAMVARDATLAFEAVRDRPLSTFAGP